MIFFNIHSSEKDRMARPLQTERNALVVGLMYKLHWSRFHQQL